MMMNKKPGEQFFKEQILLKRWSVFPAHARPADPLYKYRAKKGANKIESMVVDFLLLESHFGERTKTTGRMIEGKTIKRGMYGAVTTKGKWIPGTSTNGSSDIKAIIDGKFIGIEVKYGNDKQSLKQAIYEANILMSGGQYWTVKDFEDFFQQYQEYQKKSLREQA
jgi:hypothetical protein